jgi:hypothetical protein
MLLSLIIFAGGVYIAFILGSVDGYELGQAAADARNPLKAFIESERPFVYDNGVVLRARRVDGRQAPYYIITGSANNGR